MPYLAGLFDFPRRGRRGRPQTVEQKARMRSYQAVFGNPIKYRKCNQHRYQTMQTRPHALRDGARILFDRIELPGCDAGQNLLLEPRKDLDSFEAFLTWVSHRVRMSR